MEVGCLHVPLSDEANAPWEMVRFAIQRAVVLREWRAASTV